MISGFDFTVKELLGGKYVRATHRQTDGCTHTHTHAHTCMHIHTHIEALNKYRGNKFTVKDGGKEIVK